MLVDSLLAVAAIFSFVEAITEWAKPSFKISIKLHFTKRSLLLIVTIQCKFFNVVALK